jgi:hypothetical protein
MLLLLFQEWNPSDISAYAMLMPWSNVFAPAHMEAMLVCHKKEKVSVLFVIPMPLLMVVLFMIVDFAGFCWLLSGAMHFAQAATCDEFICGQPCGATVGGSGLGHGLVRLVIDQLQLPMQCVGMWCSISVARRSMHLTKFFVCMPRTGNRLCPPYTSYLCWKPNFGPSGSMLFTSGCRINQTLTRCD